MTNSPDKVAVITGAARGIGAATARRLARGGWWVLATDICGDEPAVGYPLASSEELDAVAADSDRILTAVADVRDNDALDAVMEKALQINGKVDAAIAVAGVIGGGAAQWETSLANEKTLIDIDLGGVLNLARAAIPAMLKAPQPRAGRFVAISSAAATRGLPNLAAYCAAKAGVAGFIRGLAADLHGTGITANAVSPGSTATDILDASADIYGMVSAEQFAIQQPIERLIRPDEIAALVEFLVGDDSGAITGSSYAVDGGLSI